MITLGKISLDRLNPLATISHSDMSQTLVPSHTARAAGIVLALVTTLWWLNPALAQSPADAKPAATPLVQLGPGDEIKYEVYGQPEMNSTLHIADDGTISIPLAGLIAVQGLSPAQAAERAEHALRDGYLVNPHVDIAVVQSRGQKISVLGEVGTPGRYPVDSRSTLFDVLAQAGGLTQTGADDVFILRPMSDGSVNRLRVNVRNLNQAQNGVPIQTLLPGDSVYVPRADLFYIYGEVTAPNKYRIETGMTVIQAIAIAGGATARGSSKRVEIKRRAADGNYTTFSAKATDLIKPDDVLRVKESLF